ncbi:MAG: InlB B-repeat-containing protein [Eubacterium sp.]|nr:InlB B-repeat-containing protein [Eubacterium sp.]
MKPRKILGIILALAMILTMIPAMTLTAFAETAIDKVEFTIEVPEAGTVVTADEASDTQDPAPKITIETSDAAFDLLAAFWIEVGDDGEFILFNGTFEAGKTYLAEVGFMADDGYQFDDDTEITVNGGELGGQTVIEQYILAALVTVTIPEEEEEEYKDEPIKSVDITIEAPKCGTVVTAQEEDEPLVQVGRAFGGKAIAPINALMKTVYYDWDSQTPYPEVSVPADALYELDETDTYLPAYWVNIDEDSRYSLYVNTEDHPMMKGGETVTADIYLRPKYDEHADRYFYFDDDDFEFNITGGTLHGDEVYGTGSGSYIYFLNIAVDVVVEHIEGDPEIENVVEPKCLEDGSHDEVIYCTACGDEISRETVKDDALGHDWGEWTVTKEPKVGIPGEEQRVCKRDPSHIETREIAPLEAKQFTITYDLNGGTMDGKTGKVQVVVDEGTTITLPTPTREGYTFDYWEGSRYEAGAKYTVTGDHTFTAQWKKKDPDIPQTGDTSNMGLWIGLMAISAAGLIGGAVYARKRR